jgi:DNA polymerase-4
MSAEETFPKDVSDKAALLEVLFAQVEEVAARLRNENVEGKTITLKLRYGNFKTITRSHTFAIPTNVSKVLWEEAKKVFEEWYTKSAGALRLLGFGVSNLSTESGGQKSLFSLEAPPTTSRKKSMKSSTKSKRNTATAAYKEKFKIRNY